MNRGRPVGEANGDGPFWPVSMATSPAAHLRRAVVIREIRHPWSTSAGETRRPPSHLNSYSRFIAFLDDASRVCCHGQFFLAENVDTLIESLRAAFYKRGVPMSLYVDNGSIYCSKEIIQICARVGCLLRHTPVRDGAAKGKIERFFRTAREQFLSRALDLSCLDAFNRQFIHWVEEPYNAQKHSVLDMTPLDRFALDRSRVRYLLPNQANDELFFVEGNCSGVIDARPHPGPLPRGEGASFAALGGSGAVRRIERSVSRLATRQQREQGSFQDAPTRSPSPRGERAGVRAKATSDLNSYRRRRPSRPRRQHLRLQIHSLRGPAA